MIIPITELKQLVLTALGKLGYTREEIPTIAEILLYAQLRGNNQGVVKVTNAQFKRDPNASAMTIDKETKLSALINGHHSPGMIVMVEAMHIALSKAKQHGFGMVGTNNTNSSTGAIGYYAHEIAKQGYIGWVFAGSPETVATHGSYQPIFGTNPLAIGVPSDNGPVVLDLATAAMAYYGLIEAQTAGKTIPPDIAYDKDGNLTSDPGAAMNGALRPFDKGYKSAGLSLMVEVLTGPLVAASFTGIGDTKGNWGNLIIVMEPELLVNRKEFAHNVSLLVEKVKQTKKLPGVKELYAPGERGDKLAALRLKKNEIEIEDNLFQAVKAVIGA